MTGLLLLVLAGCQDNNVSVLNNKPPEVSITSPVDGEIGLEGLSTELVGEVYDPDTLNNDLNIYWEDSVEGVLTGELVLEHNDVRLQVADGFSAGEHTLTLVASDPNSTASQAQVTFIVEENSPPEVSIVSPEAGDAISESSTQTLVAAVSDAHTVVDELLLIWESDQDGELDGTQEIIGNTVTFEPDPNLSQGLHTLKLKAFDSLGDWGEDSVTFSVGNTSPPEIAFLAPKEGAGYSRNETGYIEIEVTDDQIDLSSIVLSWGGFATLGWVDDVLAAHPANSGLASTAILMDCTYYDSSERSEFVLTVTATDDDGQTGQESISFYSECMPID